MKGMLIGGSAAPRAMIAGFKQRHGLNVIHGWGMTETSPVASVAMLPGDLAEADDETQFDYIALQGLPLPFVELRARDADGNEIPWDDEAMGELEIRGPWVASGYYDTPEQADRWTDDGWFKTGDIVSLHPRGFIRIQDRTKDVIKSGGEWISSVALENALMGHPAVAEAAVIAVPSEKWDERPLAVCVLREGQTTTAEELSEFLARSFAKWWLPDAFEFVDGDPEDGGRQVPQDGASRHVREAGSVGLLKAVVLRELGGPERLELADVPEPEAGAGQALVSVRAAGVNFLDVLVRRGEYPQAPPLPTILGSEVAGEIDGRRVMALPRIGGGGYAERVVADEDWIVPLPETASFAEGASFLMTFLTAYLPLVRQARVGPGSVVLVHAAAGGVGSAAVQIARHLGARVVATAGSEEKRAFALELGADEAYGYEDFAEAVRADAIVDPVGGEVFVRSLKALAPLGTLIAIGYAGGLWADLNPALVVGRNVSVAGFYLGRLMGLAPEIVREAVRDVVRLWEEGAVRPVVGAEFPLAEAAAAHALIEDRRHIGKVVLVP